LSDEEKPEHPADIKRKARWKAKDQRKPNKPGKKDRGAKYSKQLAALNIHKPARTATAQDVKVMTELKNMLRNTWASVVAEADNYKRFSAKQLEFYRRYAINGRKNRVACMKAAGYQYGADKFAYEAACRNLKQPYAEDLIRACEFEEKAKMGLMVEDVARWFENIATAAMEAGDFANANRAMENYGKYLGMFIDRKEIVHRNVQTKDELDARIRELQAVLSEESPTIAAKLTIN
jgi:hypothetical protein